MQWMADAAVDWGNTMALGLLLGEAVETLVDSHDASHDGRAARLEVQPPTMSQDDEGAAFDFRISGNRQPNQTVRVVVGPSDADVPGDDVSLQAVATCGCVASHRAGQCPHTLAAAWWLQEQIARRKGSDSLMEFLGSLKTDQVAAGKVFVSELLALATRQTREAIAVDDDDSGPSRLQWRIRVSEAAHGAPVSIQAYLQKGKRGGSGGWSRGREVRTFETLDPSILESRVDARVASLTAMPTHGVREDQYGMFESLRLLAGHDRLAWDDAEGRSIQVYDGQLSLSLEVVESESDVEDEVGPEGDSESGESLRVQYRPRLTVSGVSIDAHHCEVVIGRVSPIEPVVVLADRSHDRIAICSLSSPASLPLVQYLLRPDTLDVLMDYETASRLAVSAAGVDDLVRVSLPPQLAGPVVAAETELIFELLPRPGAGLVAALRIFEPRFRSTPVPGAEPELIPALTQTGPVRLRRNLSAELSGAAGVIERFGLAQLDGDGPMRWVATTDAAALDLLAAIHEAGDEAPRMVWPEGERYRVRGEITPKSLRVQISDAPDWFGLEGTVTIDGLEVPLNQLLAAVREDSRLVQVGDRQFARISDEFRRRLTLLGDSVAEQRGKMTLPTAAVPVAEELLSDDVEIDAGAGWHDAIGRLAEVRNWNPDRPENLQATLRDYQLDGYRWLSRLSRWGVGGVLADDMGLGKTVQTLGVLLERGEGGPALVVAPTSVGDNWVKETAKFAPDLTAKLYREGDREATIRGAQPKDLVIVSYQLLQRDAARFATRQWHTLVLDEAQFIKNSQTKTAQAIRSLPADWRLGLSGTPLENHLGELWSLFRTISPGLLGSWQRFRSRFAEPIERHNDAERRKALARLVQPFVLRRTKKAVLTELPPRTEITLRAELSPPERQLYEDARIAAMSDLANGGGGKIGADGRQQKRIQTLTWLTRLRQLACHPALVDSTWKGTSSKLELFLSLVEELREGDHRALVFSQFVKHLSVVRRALDKRGISYQYLDGSTPSSERGERVDRFQNGEGDLFLISLKAGGTGLNLTAADYVLHLDPWWNPAVEDQATDRAHRIGQQNPVTVYRLVAQNTIEEQILQLHADKRELVSGVLEGTDAAAKLKTEDLIELIRQEVG